ncbi:hypothetical protein DERF_013234 [Dermatophagoides farinae]|uniref:Uncharacterized protein n=1 Tax=Dermatophagoides farinae TaxID=6954 RepID=A0A922HLF9_DERFA|nr:hypothetical protein DERF_013234 [Dermatophagoides farinae]
MNVLALWLLLPGVCNEAVNVDILKSFGLLFYDDDDDEDDDDEDDDDGSLVGCLAYGRHKSVAMSLLGFIILRRIGWKFSFIDDADDPNSISNTIY